MKRVAVFFTAHWAGDYCSGVGDFNCVGSERSSYVDFIFLDAHELGSPEERSSFCLRSFKVLQGFSFSLRLPWPIQEFPFFIFSHYQKITFYTTPFSKFFPFFSMFFPFPSKLFLVSCRLSCYIVKTLKNYFPSTTSSTTSTSASASAFPFLPFFPTFSFSLPSSL